MKDGEDKKSGGEGFEARGGSAPDLTEDGPVDCDDQDYTESSKGEELLEKLVVGVGRLKDTEGRDDESVGVEAIAEERLLDCIFPRGGPDGGAAGEGGGADALGVKINVFCENAGERSDNCDSCEGDFDSCGSAESPVSEEIERHCNEKGHKGGFADATDKRKGEPCNWPSPHCVFAGEIKGHQCAENADHADVIGVKEDVVTETEVGHCRKDPGYQGDGGSSPDETFHDAGCAILCGLVTQDEPDGSYVGHPSGPEAERGIERTGGPEETDEVECEKGGDPAESGSSKRRRGDGRNATYIEQYRCYEQREAEGNSDDGADLRLILKPEDGEAGAESEDETNYCGKKRKAAPACGRGCGRWVVERGRHGVPEAECEGLFGAIVATSKGALM